MLHFYGIEYKNGVPQRFSFDIRLLVAFKETLARLETENCDICLSAVKNEIEKLFTDQKRNFFMSKSLKYQAKHLYLQRDILLFLKKHQDQLALLKNLLEILSAAKQIPEKWALIRDLLLACQEQLINGDLHQDLADSKSLLFSVLEIVRLGFLDQTSFKPPANLKLIFVSKKFPQHNWVSQELSEHKILLGWEPPDRQCSMFYLQNSLWQALSEQKKLLPATTSDSIPSSVPDMVDLAASRDCLPVDGNDIYPEFGEAAHDFYLTELKLPEFPEQNPQLKLLPERPWESFFAFHGYIYKKYSKLGVLIFYGILRQLLPLKGRFKVFDVNQHLALFNLIDSRLNKQTANWQKTLSILEEMEKIEVVRYNEKTEQTHRSKLLLLFGATSDKNKDNLPKTVDILLDGIFLGNSQLGYLPLGAPYFLIPKRLFTLKIPSALKGALNVMVYLTINWLSDYGSQQGVLTKTLREINDGSRLQVSKSGKYRGGYKIQAIIRYLKEQKLIAGYRIKETSPEGAWKSVYILKAAPESHVVMTDFITNWQGAKLASSLG